MNNLPDLANCTNQRNSTLELAQRTPGSLFRSSATALIVLLTATVAQSWAQTPDWLVRSQEQQRQANERFQQQLAESRRQQQEQQEAARQRFQEQMERNRISAEKLAASVEKTSQAVRDVTADALAHQQQRNRDIDASIERSAQRREQQQETVQSEAAPVITSDQEQSAATSSYATSTGASDGPAYAGEHFPQTRTRLISDEEAGSMSYAKLRYAINEVYARHGAEFAMKPELREQFSRYGWYTPRNGASLDLIEQELSSTERANIETLAKYRNMKKGQ